MFYLGSKMDWIEWRLILDDDQKKVIIQYDCMPIISMLIQCMHVRKMLNEMVLIHVILNLKGKVRVDKMETELKVAASVVSTG